MGHQTVNNNQTRIRGVFFDLYGTLLTYGDMSKAWSDWLNSFYTQLNRCGLAMSREEFASCCDCFFSKKAPKIENNDLTVFEHRIKSLCDDLNLAVKNNEIKTIAGTSASITISACLVKIQRHDRGLREGSENGLLEPTARHLPRRRLLQSIYHRIDQV